MKPNGQFSRWGYGDSQKGENLVIILIIVTVNALAGMPTALEWTAGGMAPFIHVSLMPHPWVVPSGRDSGLEHAQWEGSKGAKRGGTLALEPPAGCSCNLRTISRGAGLASLTQRESKVERGPAAPPATAGEAIMNQSRPADPLAKPT